MALYDKESQETLQGALNSYLGLLEHAGISVAEDETTALINGLFETYKEYEEFYPVKIKGHDAYKIVAWAPYVLVGVKELSEDEKDTIIATAVHQLCSFLQVNRMEVNPDWTDKLILLARNGLRPELENISIGKIGLYTSFKTTLHIQAVSTLAGLEFDSIENTLDTLFGVV